MDGKLGAEKTRQQPNGTDKQQRNDLNNGFAVARAEREAPYNPKRDEPKKKACRPVKEVSRVRHFLSHGAYFWRPSGRWPRLYFYLPVVLRSDYGQVGNAECADKFRRYRRRKSPQQSDNQGGTQQSGARRVATAAL